MLEKDFAEMLARMEEEEHKIMGTKGMEYTRGNADTDRLANFYRLGKELDLDPKIILWVYLSKHIDSIACYIKKGQEYSEERIESRIHDARNYLALLNGLIEEQKKEKMICSICKKEALPSTWIFEKENVGTCCGNRMREDTKNYVSDVRTMIIKRKEK